MTKGVFVDFPTALLEQLRAARHVVVFTGAGVSAESGIATFRDVMSGLWARFDPQALASADAFEADPELVWGWYEWRRMKVLRTQPNPAHLAIAALARQVPRLTVVTQNVDDLHERAGSPGVVHLHGSLHRLRCFACGASYSFAPGIPEEPEGGRRLAPPRCKACGGPIRPGVVWFGESLPLGALNTAYAAAEDCQLLLSVGTSGVVYPAAEIPQRARRSGASVVMVNPQPTAMDAVANYRLLGPAGSVMPALVAAVLGL
jgi:NAD-dependent deacetylase